MFLKQWRHLWGAEGFNHTEMEEYGGPTVQNNLIWNTASDQKVQLWVETSLSPGGGSILSSYLPELSLVSQERTSICDPESTLGVNVCVYGWIPGFLVVQSFIQRAAAGMAAALWIKMRPTTMVKTKCAFSNLKDLKKKKKKAAWVI